MSEPRVSPDGRWRWDGSQWVPNSPAPPPPPLAGYPQGGYAPPHQYPSYLVRPQTTNGMAIASMVLGIVWFWWIGSVLALIFGYIALNQIKERNEKGRGMAIAGVVLGWIGVGTFVFFAIAVAVSSDSSSGF